MEESVVVVRARELFEKNLPKPDDETHHQSEPVSQESAVQNEKHLQELTTHRKFNTERSNVVFSETGGKADNDYTGPSNIVLQNNSSTKLTENTSGRNMDSRSSSQPKLPEKIELRLEALEVAVHDSEQSGWQSEFKQILNYLSGVKLNSSQQQNLYSNPTFLNLVRFYHMKCFGETRQNLSIEGILKELGIGQPVNKTAVDRNLESDFSKEAIKKDAIKDELHQQATNESKAIKEFDWLQGYPLEGLGLVKRPPTLNQKVIFFDKVPKLDTYFKTKG